MRERQKIILFWLSLLLFCCCVVVVCVCVFFGFFFFFFLGGGGGGGGVNGCVCVCCFVVVVWGGDACSVTRHEVHYMQFGPGCLYDFSGWKQEKMRGSTVYPPSSRLPYQPQYALQVEYHH